MAGVSGGTAIGATWMHDLANRRTGATMGNGVTSVFDFDVNDRLTHLRHANQGTALFEVNYGYDAVGIRADTCMRDPERRGTVNYGSWLRPVGQDGCWLRPAE